MCAWRDLLIVEAFHWYMRVWLMFHTAFFHGRAVRHGSGNNGISRGSNREARELLLRMVTLSAE